MQVLEDITRTRRAVTGAERSGQTVGLVPTMGALHKGHVSLIHAARERCDFVAVTVFVNPLQFSVGEDLENYPHPLETDLKTCEQAGVDLVFTPGVETMYPQGAQTTVHVEGVTRGLCGSKRPGHLDGVATVCSILFNILPADRAFFGEKDYQQLVMIRRMVRDLNQPIEIVACPTIREEDGLAISSRNAYLSPSERVQAASLSRALFAAADRVKNGQREAAALIRATREEIQAGESAEIEYVEIVDPETLEPVPILDRTVRMCLAVRIGRCRLIDNVEIRG